MEQPRLRWRSAPGPDFTGAAAEHYASFRRDLPPEQADLLVALLGLTRADLVVDLGCGTGQIGVPMAPSVRLVVGVDPEPAMLAGLRDRAVPRVLPVLGDDSLLPLLGDALGEVGAVTIGNALHWMDEPAALERAAGVLRPGGAVAVISQGPPLWLGSAPWQAEVKAVLERERGPQTGTCGSDETAVATRSRIMTGLGLRVERRDWVLDHPVDADWVVGHLLSAAGGHQLGEGTRSALAAAVPAGAVEHATTTALVGFAKS